MLKVFAQLQNEPIELVIAGSKPAEPLPQNVKYLGFVNQVEKLYAATDVTVHPAQYEPYGQIISESIMCGTPVLISHMVGAKDVVSEKEGLVVEGFAVEDWVMAVRQMASRTFAIDPNFPKNHGLLLADHMAVILSLAER